MIVNTSLHSEAVKILLTEAFAHLILERKQLKNHRNATVCEKQPWKMYVMGSKLPNYKFLNMIKDQKCFLQHTGFKSQN